MKNNSHNPSLWFSTNEVLEYFGINEKELNIQMECFKEGIHYIKQEGNNASINMLWRLDLLDELLCLPIAPLEKESMKNAMNNKITCKK